MPCCLDPHSVEVVIIFNNDRREIYSIRTTDEAETIFDEFLLEVDKKGRFSFYDEKGYLNAFNWNEVRSIHLR